MKKVGMTYSDGDKHVNADRFLGRQELRALFTEAEYVTLSILTQRRRLHKTHSKDGHAWMHRQTTRIRNKAIWL